MEISKTIDEAGQLAADNYVQRTRVCPVDIVDPDDEAWSLLDRTLDKLGIDDERVRDRAAVLFERAFVGRINEYVMGMREAAFCHGFPHGVHCGARVEHDGDLCAYCYKHHP